MAEIAVSNIAWTNEEEPEVAKKLQELGIKKVEIAPTKRWDDPTKATLEEVRAYVDWWKEYGIDVVAFQSMLFARPDLKLFESQENRAATIEYMNEFIRLAGDMGAKRMVFGSPKNRQLGEMGVDQADVIARDFFATLGKTAAEHGVVLCIEPNAPQYNCDYITTADEGAQLVRSIGSAGIGLHLDTACMALAGDDIGRAIRTNADILEHFHVSAPMLDHVKVRDDVDYQAAADALNEVGYDKIISIEMRPGEQGENTRRVEESVRFVQQIFG